MRAGLVLTLLLTVVDLSPAHAAPPAPAARRVPDPGAFRRRGAPRPPRDVRRPRAEARAHRPRREARPPRRRHAHVRRHPHPWWEVDRYGGGWWGWSPVRVSPWGPWPFDPYGYPSDVGYLPGTGAWGSAPVGRYADPDWRPDPTSRSPLDRYPTVLDPAFADAAPLGACQLYDADDGFLVGVPVPCGSVRADLSPDLWVLSRDAAGEVHGLYADDAGRPMELVFDPDTGQLLEQRTG